MAVACCQSGNLRDQTRTRTGTRHATFDTYRKLRTSCEVIGKPRSQIPVVDYTLFAHYQEALKSKRTNFKKQKLALYRHALEVIPVLVNLSNKHI